jgi:hypothetical protein
VFYPKADDLYKQGPTTSSQFLLGGVRSCSHFLGF